MGKERGSAEERIKNIRRKTRRQYSAEEKIRIVMEGLRGEESGIECLGICTTTTEDLLDRGIDHGSTS